jgi:hypothetical protein
LEGPSRLAVGREEMIDPPETRTEVQAANSSSDDEDCAVTLILPKRMVQDALDRLRGLRR